MSPVLTLWLALILLSVASALLGSWYGYQARRATSLYRRATLRNEARRSFRRGTGLVVASTTILILALLFGW